MRPAMKLIHSAHRLALCAAATLRSVCQMIPRHLTVRGGKDLSPRMLEGELLLILQKIAA